MNFGSVKYKKGNVAIEGIVVIIILFIFSIITLVGYFVFNETNTLIQSDTEMINESKIMSGDLYSKYPTLMDNLFLFMFVLLVIFIIVSAFMVNTYPILFIISIVLIVFLLCVAGLMANAFNDFASDPTFSAFANNLTFIPFIFNHLIQVILGIVFLAIISLFAKSKLG